MSEPDEVHDESTRIELRSSGPAAKPKHQTKVQLTRGLRPFFRIGGKPVAVVGSAGDNSSADHTAPKEGDALVPMALVAQVKTGVPWFKVGGEEVAYEKSEIKVPDAEKPNKPDVLQVTQDFFHAGGNKVARGEAETEG